ncbi:hypothetical protein L6R29_22745 [Myxococcota bacterium]|nr:hypothetical protein [Myxococcota bacterium]
MNKSPKTQQPTPSDPSELSPTEQAHLWLDVWQQLPLPKPSCPPIPLKGCQRDPNVHFAMRGELGLVPEVHCQRCSLRWRSPEEFVVQQKPLTALYAGFAFLGVAVFALWWRAWPTAWRIAGIVSCILAALQLAVRMRTTLRKRRGIEVLIRLAQPISAQPPPWTTEQLTSWLHQISPKDPDYASFLRFTRCLKDRFYPLWQLFQHARLLLKQRPLPRLKRLLQQADLPDHTRAVAQSRLYWLQNLDQQSDWLSDLDAFDDLLTHLADTFQALSLKIAPDPDTPPLSQILEQAEALLDRLEQHILPQQSPPAPL